MVNNQLKNLYKKNEKSLARRKTHLKKKKRVSTGFCRVAWSRVTLGFLGFCSSRYFVLPVHVQPSGRPGPCRSVGLVRV